MSVEWLPTLPVALAFGFGFLTVPLLLVLARGPWRIEAEARRFVVATALSAVGWVSALAVLSTRGLLFGGYEVVAGALVLVTGAIGFWTLWSILCWGFTTSLLIALVRAETPVDRASWFRAYGGGSSMEGFTGDRLMLLLATGLARSEGGSVALQGALSAPFARVLRALRRIHGLRDDPPQRDEPQRRDDEGALRER